jgi:hypothetical protein
MTEPDTSKLRLWAWDTLSDPDERDFVLLHIDWIREATAHIAELAVLYDGNGTDLPDGFGSNIQGGWCDCPPIEALIAMIAPTFTIGECRTFHRAACPESNHFGPSEHAWAQAMLTNLAKAGKKVVDA